LIYCQVGSSHISFKSSRLKST